MTLDVTAFDVAGAVVWPVVVGVLSVVAVICKDRDYPEAAFLVFALMVVPAFLGAVFSLARLAGIPA